VRQEDKETKMKTIGPMERRKEEEQDFFASLCVRFLYVFESFVGGRAWVRGACETDNGTIAESRENA
jgi:hypothetical protein